MKVVGATLLLLSALAAVPLLLNFIHPLWWYDWSYQAESAPTPKDLVTGIRWATLSQYTTTVLAVLGVIFLLCGLDSRSRPEDRG